MSYVSRFPLTYLIQGYFLIFIVLKSLYNMMARESGRSMQIMGLGTCMSFEKGKNYHKKSSFIIFVTSLSL